MYTYIAAVALAAVAQPSHPAPAAEPHAQHGQSGHAGAAQKGHSQMAEHGSCCSKTADGKMQCQMMSSHGGHHQGGAGHEHQQGHGANR